MISDKALQKFFSNHRASRESNEAPGQIIDEAFGGDVISITAIAGIISYQIPAY
jgi:hypothetical protein